MHLHLHSLQVEDVDAKFVKLAAVEAAGWRDEEEEQRKSKVEEESRRRKDEARKKVSANLDLVST